MFMTMNGFASFVPSYYNHAYSNLVIFVPVDFDSVNQVIHRRESYNRSQ